MESWSGLPPGGCRVAARFPLQGAVLHRAVNAPVEPRKQFTHDALWAIRDWRLEHRRMFSAPSPPMGPGATNRAGRATPLPPDTRRLSPCRPRSLPSLRKPPPGRPVSGTEPLAVSAGSSRVMGSSVFSPQRWRCASKTQRPADRKAGAVGASRQGPGLAGRRASAQRSGARPPRGCQGFGGGWPGSVWNRIGAPCGGRASPVGGGSGAAAPRWPAAYGEGLALF